MRGRVETAEAFQLVNVCRSSQSETPKQKRPTFRRASLLNLVPAPGVESKNNSMILKELTRLSLVCYPYFYPQDKVLLRGFQLGIISSLGILM